MRLGYSRKLYSQGEHLKNSFHMSKLIVGAKCRISSKTAKELGAGLGNSLRVADKAGGESLFELEIDDSVGDGVVELICGSFSIPGFSPVRSDEAVNYVKVERA